VSISYSYGLPTNILEGKLKASQLPDGSNYYYIKYNNDQTKYFDNLKRILLETKLTPPYKLHVANDSNTYGFHTTVTQNNFKFWADRQKYLSLDITYKFRVVDGIHIFIDKAKNGNTTVSFVEWLEPYGNTKKYFTNIFKENGSELHASIGYYKF
jgi:hypothetical protein